MGERRQSRIEAEQVIKGPLFKSATYQMLVGDFLVDCDTTDGAFTVTLPPVSEAAGRIYAIKQSGHATNDLTLATKSDDKLSDGFPMTITAIGDGALVYSDGETWWVLGTIT